jgi:hypothetical protein
MSKQRADLLEVMVLLEDFHRYAVPQVVRFSCTSRSRTAPELPERLMAPSLPSNRKLWAQSPERGGSQTAARRRRAHRDAGESDFIIIFKGVVRDAASFWSGILTSCPLSSARHPMFRPRLLRDIQAPFCLRK